MLITIRQSLIVHRSRTDIITVNENTKLIALDTNPERIAIAAGCVGREIRIVWKIVHREADFSGNRSQTTEDCFAVIGNEIRIVATVLIDAKTTIGRICD